MLGVTGVGFDFPAGVDVSALVWDFAQHSRGAFTETVAGLKPGVTLEQVNAELKALHARVEKEFATTNKGWTVRVPLAHEVVIFSGPRVLAARPLACCCSSRASTSRISSSRVNRARALPASGDRRQPGVSSSNC